MVKHFCNMCGNELAKGDNFKVHARCYKLHIDSVDLDFCYECAKRAFGWGLINEAQMAYEERQKRIAERKAKMRGESNEV